MTVYSKPERRRLTVIAQDPSVTTAAGRVLMTQVDVPAERLAPGPAGHRVQVIDFDGSSNRFYRPRSGRLEGDPYVDVCDRARLEGDAHFHAQNVYAIVSATLLAFESALGRHVSWGHDYRTHQLKAAPHAFAEANAFYSRRDEGLFFGYFPSHDGKRTIYTCLSRDIIVHETTHALLDGLRRQYARPSSADQAAFHEGYADMIALLSVLSSADMIKHGLAPVRHSEDGTFRLGNVQDVVVNRSFLTGLADQMGRELGGLRRDALRRSVALDPSPEYLHWPAYQEAHTRGEIPVAAVMQAFLRVWWNRLLGKLGIVELKARDANRRVEIWRVIEEGATAAKHLLQMLIRALDYMPPIDISFGDFLSAAITADSEACPDDDKYRYRDILLESFAAYGIKPSSSSRKIPGAWGVPAGDFVYGHAHFAEMRWDREAIFRFIWENQEQLGLVPDALTMVESVRPVVRIGADGFVLHEVVAEYFQLITLRADELADIGLRAPKGMPGWQSVRLYGGSTLIFDEFGHLKFDIGNRLNSRRQSERLQELWDRGAFRAQFESERRFARLHRERAMGQSTLAEEQW
jgi:hypothetical protein